MEIYNAQPAEVDIRVAKGNTLAISFIMKLNGLPYDMSDMQLDMLVTRFNGSTVTSLSSAGENPGLLIASSQLSIYSVGFDEEDTFRYTIKSTDGVDVFTIQEGVFVIF
jgi:hypothetical protein